MKALITNCLSGPNAEVPGNIGDKRIDVSTFYSETTARYDKIEDVRIGNNLFHAH